MPFVLDASIVATWAFSDEDHPLGEAALTRVSVDETIVPALWWFEVRNVLVVNERRGRITASKTAAILRDLVQMRISVDHAPDEMAIMHLARSHRLTVYDAAYVELAMRRKASLATLDAAMVKAAKAEGVSAIS